MEAIQGKKLSRFSGKMVPDKTIQHLPLKKDRRKLTMGTPRQAFMQVGVSLRPEEAASMRKSLTLAAEGGLSKR